MIRDIKEIRRDITRTDDEIAKLFEKRMQLASQVAAYKKANSLPIYDPNRDQEEHPPAGRIFPTSKLTAFGSFKKAYEAVEKGACDCAVLPVENSFAGDVDQVNDLMFFGTLFVNGMYDLAVTHDLLGLEGTRIEDVKTVVTHPQALSQCSLFIKARGGKGVDFSYTAHAADYEEAENDKRQA